MEITNSELRDKLNNGEKVVVVSEDRIKELVGSLVL